MKSAFIIMQIGNPDLDKVCEESIVPALKECGYDPKRVDKHNEGGLLKSEIIKLIETSDIIVADLTNERPNCYLEIGYTMGLDKFRNLILTAREDHNYSSPNFKKDGPKIHFDLAGYDILFWDPNDIPAFRKDLALRIKRRIKISPSFKQQPQLWDKQWYAEQKNTASKRQISSKLSGYMEVWMAAEASNLNVSQGQLLQIADKSQIHTFGWPIGVVVNNDKDKPKPKVDGIYAEINYPEKPSFDYWAIKKDGAFYLLQTYFEEKSNPQQIFVDTRIVRITETLLYAARLYNNFQLPPNSPIRIKIMHAGLKGRIIGTANVARSFSQRYESNEASVTTEIQTSIQNIESNLVDLVEQFTKELFVVFEFFELNRTVLENITNNFVEGKIV